MKIQLVGGQHHGESLCFAAEHSYIEMPPVRGHIVEAIRGEGEWLPMERHQVQVYYNTRHDATVAGESRRVFIYNGR